MVLALRLDRRRTHVIVRLDSAELTAWIWMVKLLKFPGASLVNFHYSNRLLPILSAMSEHGQLHFTTR